MGFGFLAPLFLAGFAALAIPILVHLTHKERREPVVFPSLMFLSRIPFRTQQRQRLRHWVLFALRAAAVVLLVSAFARPFVERRQAAGPGRRDVVLLLDRSASMSARGVWARAQQAAREVMTSLPAGSRVAIVGFDDRAEVLAALTDDRTLLGAALDGARAGSAAGRYAPGIQAASAVIERAGGPADVVLISDFQRAGWDGGAAARLPPGASLRTADVGDTTLINNTVAGAILERRTGTDPQALITARIAAARGSARDVRATLEVEGRALETITVRIEPGGAALARFAPLRDPASPRAARIVLAADAQPVDDAWHFVLGPAPRLGVVLVTRADAPARDALYLRQALAVAGDPAFPVTLRSAAAIRDADLASAAVVIVHDAPFPGGDAGRRLLAWVRGGGGLLIGLGARGTLPSELADSLGAAGPVVDRGESGASAAVEVTHPVFEGWSSAAGLSGSRAFRYRRLERAAAAPARWDDGAAALAETRLGTGRVLVWTADFANRWSDLPLHPTFVPMVHGLVRHLAGFAPPRESRLAGDVVELDASPGGSLVVERPDGGRDALPAGEPARLLLRDHGFYAVRGVGGNATPLLLAANVPPAEADPARVIPEQLATALAPDAALPVQSAAGAGSALDRSQGQRLWWFALAAALLLFTAESAVAHRMRGNR